MKKFLFIAFLLPIMSCASLKKPQLLDDSRFVIHSIATDITYGVTPENPVNVGGFNNSEGPINEKRYLNSLTGPNGESISYHRAGSCCAFKTKKGLMGLGLLDNYRVTWEGSTDTISIYINMYDYDKLYAPLGFTIKE